MPAGRPATIHLNTEKALRGGEVQNLGLMEWLVANGHRCLLASPAGSPLAVRARRAGIEHVDWNPSTELSPSGVLKLLRLIPEGTPAVLHAHTAHALAPAVLAAMARPRVKVVASRRVSFPFRSLFSKMKYKAADAVVAVCGSIAEQLVAQGIPAEKVHLIHSGVDLERFRAMPPREEARRLLGIVDGIPTVGVAGALVSHKGHGVLFEAASMLREKLPGLHLLLAGEGELRGRLETLAAQMGVSTTFLGYSSDLPRFYAALDVLAMPSLSGEGSPGSMKEAAAAGVPVVASRVGGAGEILRDGQEALLVPPGDARALARGIEGLLGDAAKATRLTAAARARVEGFSILKMAEAHGALYEALISSGP